MENSALEGALQELSELQARHRDEIQACLQKWLLPTKGSGKPNGLSLRMAALETPREGAPLFLDHNGTETRRHEPHGADLTLTSGKYASKTSSDNRTHYNRAQKWAQKVVGSRLFVCVIMLTILANAILIGFDTQRRAREGARAGSYINPHDVEVGYLVLFYVFILEVALRCFAQRMAFFSSPSDRWWNLLDFVCLVLACLYGARLVPHTIVAFRLVRGAWILRVVKASRRFHDLRLMITCMISSVKSLIWVLAIVTCFLYLFGLILTDAAVLFLCDQQAWGDLQHATLEASFGTLNDSMMSLLQAMTGGRSWGEYLTALRPLGWEFSLVFLVFIFFSIFAIMNVVTAVFVDCAITSSEEAKRMQHEQLKDKIEEVAVSMRKFFGQIDTDMSGSITRSELSDALAIEDICKGFSDAGIDIRDADKIFDMIDTDGEGTVSIDEFLDNFTESFQDVHKNDISMLKVKLTRVRSDLAAFGRSLKRNEQTLRKILVPANQLVKCARAGTLGVCTVGPGNSCAPGDAVLRNTPSEHLP